MEDNIKLYMSWWQEKGWPCSESQMQEVVDSFKQRDYITLAERLATHNKLSRRVFKFETGIELPPTNDGTCQVLQTYCAESYNAWKSKRDAEIEERKIAERKATEAEDKKLSEELDGFMDGKMKAQRVRARDFLYGHTLRYDGTRMTYIEAIRNWKAEGTLRISTKAGRLKFPRNWNSMGYAEQRDWERRNEEAKSKTVYCVSNNESSYWELGKIAYDYASYLLDK